MSIVSQFFSDRRQRVRLDDEISASVDLVSEVAVLESFLFILHPSDPFHIVGHHIVGYADNTTMYAVIPRPLSHYQVMELLKQNLAAKNSWC